MRKLSIRPLPTIFMLLLLFFLFLVSVSATKHLPRLGTSVDIDLQKIIDSRDRFEESD